MVNVAKRAGVLELFHPAVAEWFRASFEAPTPPQTDGWPAIARGESTLILAPTGSGKTLTAFLWAINRVMFPPSLASAPARATVDKSVAPLASPLAPPKLRSSDRGLVPPKPRSGEGGCRVIYVSPLKALAVDVERNLRAPIAGIAHLAAGMGVAHRIPAVAVRTGDT